MTIYKFWSSLCAHNLSRIQRKKRKENKLNLFWKYTWVNGIWQSMKNRFRCVSVSLLLFYLIQITPMGSIHNATEFTRQRKIVRIWLLLLLMFTLLFQRSVQISIVSSIRFHVQLNYIMNFNKFFPLPLHLGEHFLFVYHLVLLLNVIEKSVLNQISKQ